jgi:Tol biopolymer transport system component/DNA-binding winged helix-turn-helix (wHTH) protein
MNIRRAFQVGRCVVDPCDFSIQIEGGDKCTIQPKQIDVIYYLAQHYPKVITRQELIDNVWQGNIDVGEKSLNNTIWHLRQSLAEATSDQTIIETIRRAGYRLLVEPKWLQTDADCSDSVNSIEHMAPETQQPKSLEKFTWRIATFVFFILALGIYFGTSTPKVSSFVIESLTKQPGSELFAAPSPSGRFVVYRWVNPEGRVNLYMIDREQDQLAPIQLTFTDEEEVFSVWSPDEQYLYFSRQDRGSEPLCDIIRLNIVTHNEKRLAQCSVRNNYQYIDISPDGNTLAFIGYSESLQKNGIYFIDLNDDTKPPIRFSCAQDCKYKDRDMAFSPDGKKIAISRRDHQFDESLYLIDLKSKQEERLTSGEIDIVGFTWHPDGEHIIYASQRSDMRNGYVLNVDSKQKDSLNVESFSYPAYSRESAELFYQKRNEKYHIASLDLAGTSSPFPVLHTDFSYRYPDYSVQTDKIVYISNESGYYELWTSDTQGNNRQQLTDLKQNLRYPKWSHDGKKVAFLAPKQGASGYKIYIVDTATQQVSIVPTTFEDHGRPTWSYQDDAIISSVSDGETSGLYQFTLTDGEAKQLTFNGGLYGVMLSDSSLLFTSRNGGLWQKELSSDKEPTQILDESQLTEPFSWVYHDNGIYFRQSTEKHKQFMHYNLIQDNFTVLVRVPMFQRHSGISLNPTTGQLFFTHNAYPQSDIKKLEHPLLP